MIFRIPEHIALTFESPTQWMMNIRRSETELIKEPITVSYQPTRIHFAVVINSGSVQVYYSGKLVYQRGFDQGFQVHSSELYLGFNSTSADGDFLGFEGVLDECRISNIARYSEDFVPAKRFEPDEQTIALYHMDQNDEEQLTDSSGNGRHGRILSYSWSKNADAEMYQLQVEMDAFVAEVSLLAPEAQIEAFRLKMIEANPGYDGKLKHSVRNGNVTTLECLSDHMKTIWPVRVFKQLEKLHIGGQNSDTILTDLTPLKGLPLKDLDLRFLPAPDLTPLKGMPLEIFGFYGGRLTDLAPISNCPLKELQLIYTSVTDLTPLKEMQLRNFLLRGSDVVDFSVLKGLPITHLDLANTKVSDLSPLQGMPLTSLNVRLTAVTDLSSVEGLPLTDLDISETNVRDLSALQGMPLKKLSLFDATDISDLSPLQAAPIEELNMNGLKGVSDLSTLRGMKNLKSLFMDRTGVSDLTPIENLPIELLAVRGCPLLDLNAIKRMPLKQLFIPVRWFRPDEHQFLRSLPLETLNGSFFAGGMPVKEFWEQFDTLLQAAIEFAEATAKLPVEQQSDLVLAKLQELNENQEIKLETQITNNAVSTVKVTLLKSNENLTPLRAFGQMKELQIVGGRTSLDLSPIDIAPIEMLTCDRGIVLRNLSILREMPTLKTINGEPSKEYLDAVEADPWPKEGEVEPKAT